MKLLSNLSQIGRTIGFGELGLFNFHQNKPSNAYVPTAGCVLDHILSAKNLSDLEKLYYILANSLSSINLYGGGKRAIALSAVSWAKRLDCAKSKVFAMQKSLEDKGYFILSKDTDKYGHNKRNLICPTLPDCVFLDLSNSAKGRGGEDKFIYNPLFESKVQFLDRTKLFIILGYQVLKNISACPYLTSFHKIVWLDFYTICYKARVGNLGAILIDDEQLDFSFITSYKQLEDKYSCTKSLLSKTLVDLQELGLIKREQFYTKKEQGDQERQDKSLWKISLISSNLSGSSTTGAKGQGGEPNLPSGFNGGSFGSFNSQGTLLSSWKASNNESSNNAVNHGCKDINYKSSMFIDACSNNIGTHGIVIGIDKEQSRNVSNWRNCKLLPTSKNDINFESLISPDNSDHLENDDSYSSYGSINSSDRDSTSGSNTANNDKNVDEFSINKSNIGNIKLYTGSEFSSGVEIFQPSKTSEISFLKAETKFDISYHDPEVTSNSLYNTNDINKHIYKSNNVYVDKKLTTEYIETIKNGWQNAVGGYDTARTDFKGVLKGKFFPKEKIRKISKFSVSGLLIKEKLKLLSKDKANKARKFAYSLFSKEIVKGYASTVSKHELAKQFIFHATSWRPTKIARGAGEEELVDIALSVAWNAAVSGDWKEPLEWAKAKALQYEFLDYKRKYRDSGIISHELVSLETMINNFLGTNYNLSAIIAAEVQQEMEAEEPKLDGVGGVMGGDIGHVEALNVLKLEAIKGSAVSNVVSSAEPKIILRNLINKLGNQSSGNFENSQNLLYHYEEVNTVNIVKEIKNVQILSKSTGETMAVSRGAEGDIGWLHNKHISQVSYMLDSYYKPGDNTGDGIALPVTNYNHSNNDKHILADEELKGSVLVLSHTVRVQQKKYINKSGQYTRGDSTFCCESMIQSKKFDLTKYKGGVQDYGYNIHKSLWRTELDLFLGHNTNNINHTYITKGDTHTSNITKDFTKIDKALNDILQKIMKKN